LIVVVCRRDSVNLYIRHLGFVLMFHCMNSKAAFNIGILFPKIVTQRGRQDLLPYKLKYLNIRLLKILPDGSEITADMSRGNVR
jgi:hypothetical protein